MPYLIELGKIAVLIEDDEVGCLVHPYENQGLNVIRKYSIFITLETRTAACP